ncbi:unnamed protein product [Peronospora effusa]|nr:unnamed protein product [Peronospora effusa]
MVHLAPCRTKISGKEAALLFLDHAYRLHVMPESIVSDRDPRFTSGFWRHVFELLGSKLYMSTAGHPHTYVQTEQANRFVADVLRTIATPKEWRKQLPFVEFAIMTVCMPVRVKHRFTLTDCVILERQSRLYAARVLVREGPSLRSVRIPKRSKVALVTRASLAVV